MLQDVRGLKAGAGVGDASRGSGMDVAEVVRLGGRVRHKSFGDGVVLGVEGRGEHTRVQVNFEAVGNKWLVLAYANLEAL